MGRIGCQVAPGAMIWCGPRRVHEEPEGHANGRSCSHSNRWSPRPSRHPRDAPGLLAQDRCRCTQAYRSVGPGRRKSCPPVLAMRRSVRSASHRAQGGSAMGFPRTHRGPTFDANRPWRQVAPLHSAKVTVDRSYQNSRNTDLAGDSRARVAAELRVGTRECWYRVSDK